MEQYGHCMKCKKKTKMSKVQKIILGNRLQVKGLCAVCKTKMSVFAKK